MEQSLVIGDMTIDNIGDVAKIERECFSRPWSLDALKSELTNPNAVFRVAGIDGVIAGYAGMHHIVDEGYITNVAVLQHFRRKGIAKALVEDMLRYGRQNGLALITLEVRQSNVAAQALYAGFGFEAAGLRKGFYESPAEDGIIMTVMLGAGR